MGCLLPISLICVRKPSICELMLREVSVFYKKIKGLLSAIFIIGIILVPSDSWSMHRERAKDNSHDVLLIPSEVWESMFWNHLAPSDWIIAGLVCKYWSGVANSKNLWGKLNGQTPFPCNPKENEEKLQALTTLFQKTPPLQKLFSINLSITHLEKLLPKTIENPTNASYKYYFMSQFFESLAQRQCRDPTLVDQTRVLFSKAKEYMEKAYTEGNLKAGRKIEFGKIKNLDNNPTAIDVRNNPKAIHYLIAALLGSSKAEENLGEIVMNHFCGWSWIRTLSKPEYFATYQGSTPSQAEEQLNALISLGNTWPGGIRKSILSFLYSPQKSAIHRLEDLEAIAEGKKAVNLYGKFFTLEWPEAYCILGDLNTKDAPDKAKNYFEQAIEKKVKNSEVSLAEILAPLPENEVLFRNILKNNPHSGTVLSKIGQILMAKIPTYVDGKPEDIKELLDFIREAHGRLSAKRRGLHPGFICHQQLNKQMKVKTPENIIEFFGIYLTEKSINTRCSFLDVAMAAPCFSYEPNWVAITISTYWRGKWGFDIFNSNIQPSQTTIDKWNRRDALYGLLIFDHNNDKIKKRNFYSTLMAIALQKKEEDWFVKAFKNFHSSVTREEVGITNYNLLRANKNKFMKIFPKNVVVEQLFNTLPIPIPKKKNAKPLATLSTDLNKSGKRKKPNDEDSWDGT